MTGINDSLILEQSNRSSLVQQIRISVICKCPLNETDELLRTN